jgi:hypothetical protein
MTKQYAKIDINGIFYTKNDCEKILSNKKFILEIQKSGSFVSYSEFERPVWILKESIVKGYGVTYKKKIYRIINAMDIGLD